MSVKRGRPSTNTPSLSPASIAAGPVMTHILGTASQEAAACGQPGTALGAGSRWDTVGSGGGRGSGEEETARGHPKKEE